MARAVTEQSLTSERGGSIGLVLLIAIVLTGAAAGLIALGHARAEPYVLALLAVLAMVGVFLLLALSAGILRTNGSDRAAALVKSIVQGARESILVTDANGRVVYVNRAYLDLTGAANPGDARPVERVFVGDPGVSEAIYRLLKAAREGRSLQEEVRIAGRPDEPGRWLRMRVRPLGDDKRLSRLSVWVIADVTRDLERQENVFQELQHAIDYLDHAPAGFFSVDANGEVSYINATLAEWLDHDLAQVGSGGLKLSEIVAGEGAALLTTMAAAPGEVKTEVLDIDLKSRSGRTVPVRLFHKVAFSVEGAAGPSRTLVLNRTREGDADPLRAAEVRFMRFFHNTPMAIATVDKQGNIARSNALFVRLFNLVLKEEGTKQRSILSVVAARDRGPLEAAIRMAAQGRGDIAPVDAALEGDGDRSARFYVTAVEEEKVEREAAIVYALDTTQQRELETQVNQQQKLETIGRLVGNVAHDFNNLLGAIMMATDFLLNAHRPTDPSFRDIMEIKQNANRAASLVRQLLAFSRRQTLRPQVIDLGEAVADLNVLLKRLIGEKVQLKLVTSREKLWQVKADIGQFEQSIINLAVNARDAMPSGGVLTLRTANIGADESARMHYKGMPVGEYVLVEVADTGTGIAPEIIDKIFDPFYTTKEVGKGTGLGLASVYGFIKQTGGFIYVESEINKGTTFRIFIARHTPLVEDVPLSQLPDVRVPATADSVSALGDAIRTTTDLTGEGTILLVEDEEGLRALNARGLASRGYTVIEAGNGLEAIEALERNGGHVDLVVSDVMMPEMDGPTLFKELRKRRPGIKVIFVSGYAEDAFQKNLPGADQFDFLPKPFTLKQLVAQVKETMGK
jgi:two-component system cell cycle sensor histidine kinase/response regulator CckA